MMEDDVVQFCVHGLLALLKPVANRRNKDGGDGCINRSLHQGFGSVTLQAGPEIIYPDVRYFMHYMSVASGRRVGLSTHPDA